MTIEKAIKFLRKLEEIHGNQIEVYFDCPECKKSFTPTTVVTEAIHITGEQK